MVSEGYISIWVCNFNRMEDLQDYIKVTYNQGGDTIPSEFRNDYKIDYYDEDFLEVDCYDQKTNNLNELFAEFSYDDKIIAQLKELFGDCLEHSFNAVILLYNYSYKKNIKEIVRGANKLKYLTSVMYK